MGKVMQRKREYMMLNSCKTRAICFGLSLGHPMTGNQAEGVVPDNGIKTPAKIPVHDKKKEKKRSDIDSPSKKKPSVSTPPKPKVDVKLRKKQKKQRIKRLYGNKQTNKASPKEPEMESTMRFKMKSNGVGPTRVLWPDSEFPLFANGNTTFVKDGFRYFILPVNCSKHELRQRENMAKEYCLLWFLLHYRAYILGTYEGSKIDRNIATFLDLDTDMQGSEECYISHANGYRTPCKHSMHIKTFRVFRDCKDHHQSLPRVIAVRYTQGGTVYYLTDDCGRRNSGMFICWPSQKAQSPIAKAACNSGVFEFRSICEHSVISNPRTKIHLQKK